MPLNMDDHLVRNGAVLLIAALLTLTGCQTSQSTADREMRTARAVQHPMLVNIPLPRGFSSIDSGSMAFESGRTRMARFEFEGDASRIQVQEFFLEHMRSAGFHLIQRQVDEGIVTIIFRSVDEECTIRIGPRGLKTYFIIHLMPLPQGTPAEAEDFPPERAG